MPISESDRKRFFAEAHRNSSLQSIAFLFNLSDELIASFAIDRHRFPGVELVVHLSRRYLRLDLAAHAMATSGA